MAVGVRQQASRAFVAVLLLLARTYNLILTVNRDSSTEELLKAYRKLLLKTRPDKGGKAAHLRKLRTAKEDWEKALLKILYPVLFPFIARAEQLSTHAHLESYWTAPTYSRRRRVRSEAVTDFFPEQLRTQTESKHGAKQCGLAPPPC